MARKSITPAPAAGTALRRALLATVALLLVAVTPTPTAQARAIDAVAAQACTISGDGGADRLPGTAADDILCGRGGADIVRGAGGSDVLNGGTGGDLLQGKAGSDRVNGGAGNDRTFGGAGADDLRGGPGNDGLGGGLGPDDLSGGTGLDVVLYGQRGRSVRVSIGGGAADGEAGEGDNVKGDVEAVQGGRGNDVLTGNARANALTGGAGNDRLRGMRGNDLLVGGAGTDRLDAREAGAGAAGQGGTGFVDRVVCGAGNDTALVDASDIVDPDCENVIGAAPSPPQNNAPTGLALSNASVAENQPAGTTVGTLSAGDPDPGDTHAFELVPGAGSQDNASFQIVGSTLRTAAAFNYEAKNSYSVRIRATDFGTPAGQIAREFTIAVTDVDEAPTAVDDSATVAEDAGATAIDVLANDTDPDGGPTITLASDPTNGTVVLAGGLPGAHTGLTYQPDPGYCNDPPGTTPDTFTYTLNGGATATVSVTVSCVDNPPTAVDDSATVGEDSAANAIDVLANDTDVDGGPMTIDSVTQPANGTVVITGGGTGLTYQPDPNYCNSQAGGTPDTFTYTLNGGDTATVSVTVTCADDPPTAVDDNATVGEDSGASPIDVLANDSDPDGDTMTITSASDPANGTVVVTGGGTGLTYQPDPNDCNSQAGGTPDTFTYTLNGGDTATVSMTVTCVPDDPVVTTSAGNTSYTENDPATPIDSAVLVSDPDAGTTITGATVQITAGYVGAEDILALAGSHPGISPSVNGDTLTLTGDAGPAAYQAALRDVTYRNGSDAPSTAARTITFTVTDDTSRTGSDTKGVTVIAVDDPPVAVNDSATVLEDAAATAVPVLANDTDVDDGPMTINSASDPANGTVVITGGGTGLTYQPDPNYCNDPPGTTPDTFTYTLNGGDTATVSVTVTCVNDAPVADDETFNGAVGNTTFIVDDPSDGAPTVTHPQKTISGDILDGDSDVDGPGPLTVTVVPITSADGASVTIEADGDFTYLPTANSCSDTTDSFNYTVEDSGSPELTDSGTVTIQLSGCVWYVSNNAAGNAGTASAPFDTLDQAETPSGANHTVFVFDGTGASYDAVGGYAMTAGERLIGEHEGLQVGADTLHPANPGAHPTLTATGADVIDLDDGNEVRGLNVDPQGTGGGIAGTAGDTGGGTIDDVNVVDTLGTNGTQPGLELNGTTGTFNISNFTVNNNATGVLLNSAGTVNFTPAGTITITSAGAPGLSATNTNMGTSTFDAISVTGSATGGVSITNPTNPTPGSTTFDGLSLTTTGGTGFLLSNAGTISVPAVATANVNATGGPAVDVTGTAGAALAFDAVSSTNSVNDGINLAGLGTGTFSATGGTIAGATGIAFDLDGGGGEVTYPGSLNNGAGATAEITGRSGGAVTLSGAIADTNDAGGGISLSGNTGGSTTFSNASKVLNTTTSDAVSFSSSDGHTLNLTGGGLDIDATSGAGLAATNSGTLVVSGAGNTIDTTTGRALNVTNTDFGAADVTFQSISSNGAASGILLDTTGVAGNLAVTGNGGTCTNADTSGCSGGRIRNGAGTDDSSQTPVGTGIVLRNTADPSFTRVWLHDHSNYALRGNGVTGFTLANSVVNGTNGNNGTTPFDDGGVIFNNLTGSASVSNSAISGGFENDFRVTNSTGNLNRITFLSDTFGVNSVGTGNDAVGLESSAAAGQLHATVQDSTFTRAAGDHVDYSHNGSGTGDLDLINNDFSNNHPTIATGGGGLTLSNNGTSGNTTMDIDENTFRDAVGPGVLVFKTTGPSTQTGTFTDNTIGVAAATNSGSAEGSALKLQAVGQGASNWTVTNNAIRGYNNFGIEVLAGGGATAQGGNINATITGNTITQPGNTAGTITIPKQGVHFNIGTVPGDTYQACAVITGNDLATSGADSVPSTINVDVRLRQRQSTTIRLPGYSGGATDTTAVQNFVAANNPGAEDVLAQVNSPPGGGFTGGAPATCP